MKADKSKMFSIELNRLKAEDGAPFPLFLFLKKNERFVPVRLPGDPIGLAKYESFLKAHHAELWVPVTFKDIYASYLAYLERSGTQIAGLQEAVQTMEKQTAEAGANPSPAGAIAENTPTPAAVKNEVPAAPKCAEAELVRDVLEDDGLTPAEKAEVLSAVSQDLMRALNQITTRGEEARAKGIKTCKEVADEILSVAAQESNIYEEILALRTSQEEIEHSVITGTLAAMFGMALGYTDEILLADMIVASIFHDIGLVRVKPEVSAKPEAKWTQEDRKEYENHVHASVAVMKESGAEFSARVFRMIAEHHENYDGSGFPGGLRGAEIDEGSQVVHMANVFDRICNGKQTGKETSPAEAFDYIYATSTNPDAVQELQPELVQRVFQFMLQEESAVGDMRQEAAAKVESISAKI